MGWVALINKAEEGCEKTGGPPVVGVGKSRTGYGAHPQVVKIGKPGFEDPTPSRKLAREVTCRKMRCTS
jgi:hypothetical protein